MIPKIKYDPKYKPSEEVLRKLERSLEEVELMKMRDLNCPICGFKLESVYADSIGHEAVKCNKCKFCGPLNLAYFRTQRKYSCLRWDDLKSKQIVR